MGTLRPLVGPELCSVGVQGAKSPEAPGISHFLRRENGSGSYNFISAQFYKHVVLVSNIDVKSLSSYNFELVFIPMPIPYEYFQMK